MTKQLSPYALSRYVVHKMAILEMIDAIKEHLENYDEINPDDVHWGHVTDMFETRIAIGRAHNIVLGIDEEYDASRD